MVAKATVYRLIRRLRKFCGRGGKQNCADAGWHSATGRGSTVIRLSKDGITIVGGSVFTTDSLRLSGSILCSSLLMKAHSTAVSMAGSVNAGPGVHRYSGINLVITREAVPQGTLTPGCTRKRWRCTRANLMGTPNMLPGNHSGRGPGLAAGLFLERPEDEGNQGRISQIAVFQRREIRC